MVIAKCAVSISFSLKQLIPLLLRVERRLGRGAGVGVGKGGGECERASCQQKKNRYGWPCRMRGRVILRERELITQLEM